ncbi:hypothetical protein [Paraburkholderia strydomiana]|uniref:hypothetical protein n=1 Tax=Paraburkholderia strydomiana TaxID=1245417 RepID=UPI0038BD911C
MKHLTLNRLYIQSSSQELGGQFQFKKGLNLITGVDNSIGKSTLARLPYWTLGCDYTFSDTWRGLDVRAILHFTVNGVTCIAARWRNKVRLKVANGPWAQWDKITGAFSEAVAELVGFVAKLANKKHVHIFETPPPAYYFLAFYVDQKKGWSQAWNSFEGLTQYADWREKIIRAHVGYYNSEYFELASDIALEKYHIKAEREKAQELGRAAEIVETFIPAVEMAATTDELDAAMSEISQTLVGIRARESHALTKLNERREELMFLKVQRDIATEAIRELQSDYAFAVENVPEDVLTCPLCGTLHDNSLLNRAELLQDKGQAETQLDILKRQYEDCEKSIAFQESRLAKIRTRLQELEEKVGRISGDVGVRDILAGLAASTVRLKADEANAAARANAMKRNKSVRQFEKAQRETKDADTWAKIDKDFQDELLSLCSLLRVNLMESIGDKTVVDYRRIVDSGGAAEGARLHLAYQLALYHLIELHGTELVSALVLDTPNQQDQAPMNYEVIHKAIMKYVRKDGQLVLCATRSPALKAYESGAHVIELDGSKLLTEEGFGDVKAHFDDVFA